MFAPNYYISARLLDNVKRIATLVTELNFVKVPDLVLFELEENARVLSSHTSTRIEGNPLPLNEVKKIFKQTPENVRESEREVLNYNDALRRVHNRIQDETWELTLDFILDIQQMVTRDLVPDHQCGRLRQEPVVVYDPVSREVVFLPPDYQHVPQLLDDLIHFVKHKREEIDPLIIAAIFHKQFIIIHPFVDGNGRTARLVTTALIASLGLNFFSLFSFENYYNQNTSRYFHQVGLYGNYYELVGHIEFTAWLEYFTDGIIDELLRVADEIDQRSKSYQLLKPHEIKIINFIEEHGFINNQQYSQITTRAKATRSKDLQELVKKGILERKGKTRGTYYIIKHSAPDTDG